MTCFIINHDGICTLMLQDDLRMVDALEWLTFNVDQRPEALRQANAIMRVFLGLYSCEIQPDMKIESNVGRFLTICF